jgi:hypothetical protein
MPSPLVIPGVQVKTLFEPAPVLPGATGILGVVGVADRGPITPTPVGSVGELTDVFGPATRYTMPEIRTALANGVAEVVVARTAPGAGARAEITLLDDEKEQVAILRARAEGAWGNKLAVRVAQVKPASGRGIKYVNLDVFYDGALVESFTRLLMDEDSPDYFFSRINQGSRLIVATDPAFDVDLPLPLDAPQKFVDAEPAPATAKIKASGEQIGVTAKRPGRAGNQIVVTVREAAPGLQLLDGTGKALVDLRRKAGPMPPQTDIDLTVQLEPGKLTIFKTGGNARVITPVASVDALITALQNDPDLEPTKLADGALAPLAQTVLKRRVDIEVGAEGRESRVYSNLGTTDGIKSIDDPLVSFDPVPKLADPGDYPLTGGRNKGPALALLGNADPNAPLLELTPANDAAKDVAIAIRQPAGAHGVDIEVLRGADTVESFTGLTMDPDDPAYLVDVLSQSASLRARDLFIRQHADNFPRDIRRPQSFDLGASPTPDDYGDALDRLQAAEEVDLVVASVANQYKPDSAAIRDVQKLVVAHCTKMADVARNRIGLGSITTNENSDITKILDHADDVRSDYFILCAPAGSEAAMAGLLGRQDYFQSPTFKTIASVDAPLVPYSDAQLTQLVPANVAVITKKRKFGVIVVKGLLTSGRQINVQRTANKSVRDVKAIADKYIGLLNDAGTRNALRQQIIALFTQMERDGALVPSTDGQDPAFKVDVYSTEADFANGIVHIDIAVRPVRAIDYVYATILVEN